MRKDVEEFLRGKLALLYSQCPPKSQAKFDMIFPDKKIPVSKLEMSIDLLERSLKTNEKANGYMWKEWMGGILE